MKLFSRRQFIKLMGGSLVGVLGFGGYAFGFEPLARLAVTRYALTPSRWPTDLKLRIAILADLHACEPWMPEERIGQICEEVNALKPDIILLLGDYVSGIKKYAEVMPANIWANELARLSAPLGVHAVLGNHDWLDDPNALQTGELPIAGQALVNAGVNLYGNRAVQLSKQGQPFWLAGLEDQLSWHWKDVNGKRQRLRLDDLPATLAQVTDDAPVILMAHEPDIFPQVPERVSVTLCGHTHGGQIRLFGYSPFVPSKFKNRYAYGHIVEENRHLIVSGGLGCTGLPVRFGMPPEIVVLELGGGESSTAAQV